MSTKSQLKILSSVILLTILLPLLASVAVQQTSDPSQAPAGKAAYYLAEHGDLDIGFEEGRLDLHVHVHAGGIINGEPLEEDTAFDPDEVIVVATQEAKILRPAGPLWNPTGVDVNEPLWVMPQHEKEGLPMFGLATEDIDPGIFVGDTVTLSLRHVKGPGYFSLWADDAFGQPGFLLSTHDHMLSTTLPVGLHAHNNWGFTRPGTYTVVFEVTGTLVAGGSTSTLAIYTFLVSESPIPLEVLPGDVNLDGTVNESDLQIVKDNLGRTCTVWPAPEDKQ